MLRGHDVDDVFQATFLALAKQAGAIRRRQALGAWLYEIAYHAALRAKARRARDQRVERAAATAEGAAPNNGAVYGDEQIVLDEELHRLPERLRRPLVLVHLLGQVQVQAARELGITDRALRKRLRIGRERLRLGLTRRGVTLTAAGLAAVLDGSAAAGPLALGLVRPTVESVLAYAAGQIGAVPAATVSLTIAGAGGWLAGRFKLISLLAVPVLATVVFTASAFYPGGDKSQGSGARSQGARAPGLVPPPTAPDSRPLPLVTGPTALLTGQVLGADGKPVPHAVVSALVRRPWQSSDRGLHDDIVARGAADAEGRYRLAVPANFPSSSPERRVMLLAYAPGLAPVTGEVSLGGTPVATDLRLRVKADVTGRLVGQDGRAAAAVRLAVVRLGKAVWEPPQGGELPAIPQGWPNDATTNDNGEFNMKGLPADENLWLQVRDDRYALTTFPVKAGVKETVAVKLGEARLLTGRITAADTGRPLLGARVAVIVGPDRATLDYYTALAAAPEVAAAAAPAETDGRTDADGHYRLRLPPGAAYHVHVYPPTDSAYIGWHWTLNWSEGESTRERTAALPPGIELKGQIVETDGRPIRGACVSWGHDTAGEPPAHPGNPSVLKGQDNWTQALVFSDTATLTGEDGVFRVVVPAKPVLLRIFGPTADYRLCDYTYQRCPQCGKEHLRPGEHARVRIAPSVASAGRPESGKGPVDSVPSVDSRRATAGAAFRVTLHRGLTITGRAIGPDGEPIREGVVICRTVDQPLRKPTPRPLPIRDGRFELPGCVAGRVYPVLLLDSARGLAAVADLRADPQAAEATSVRLARCGTATVRLVDAAGRPLAGRRPNVMFWLADDRPAAFDTRGNGPWSTPLDSSWVDPRHYLPGPVTDADGLVAVQALVPGLQYHVTFSDWSPQVVATAPFRVRAGEAMRLPDLVVPPKLDDEGHAAPQIEKLHKDADAPARK